MPSKGQLVLTFYMWSREEKDKKKKRWRNRERKNERRVSRLRKAIPRQSLPSSLRRQMTRFHLRGNRKRRIKLSWFYIRRVHVHFLFGLVKRSCNVWEVVAVIKIAISNFYLYACYMSRNVYTQSPITQHPNV